MSENITEKPDNKEFYGALMIWICALVLFVISAFAVYINKRTNDKENVKGNKTNSLSEIISEFMLEPKEDA